MTVHTLLSKIINVKAPEMRCECSRAIPVLLPFYKFVWRANKWEADRNLKRILGAEYIRNRR